MRSCAIIILMPGIHKLLTILFLFWLSSPSQVTITTVLKTHCYIYDASPEKEKKAASKMSFLYTAYIYIPWLGSNLHKRHALTDCFLGATQNKLLWIFLAQHLHTLAGVELSMHFPPASWGQPRTKYGIWKQKTTHWQRFYFKQHFFLQKVTL